MTGSPGIGLAGWCFLVFAGVMLPLAVASFALSERRRTADGLSPEDAAEHHGPTRVQLYAQALLTHAVLLGVGVVVARLEDVTLFASTSVGPRDVAAAMSALVVVLAIGELSWRSRSPDERERLWVRRILPRTPSERRAWIVVSASAAIAEEIAYRGVFVAIAASATGSLAAAIIASASAFALVHSAQGLAAIGYVFLIALVHQAVVLATGTLLLAILVHFAYDVLAGLWLARRHGLVNVCVLPPCVLTLSGFSRRTTQAVRTRK